MRLGGWAKRHSLGGESKLAQTQTSTMVWLTGLWHVDILKQTFREGFPRWNFHSNVSQ